MLKLKLQYFGHLTHLKRPWCWERLKAGEEGDNRGWDGWMASPTQWAWVWVNSRSWWWTSGLVCCSPWGCKESDVTEWLNWTDTSERVINTYDLFLLKACTSYWDKLRQENSKLWLGHIQLILIIWCVSYTVLDTGNIVVNRHTSFFIWKLNFMQETI